MWPCWGGADELLGGRDRVTPKENLQVFKEKMQQMYNSDTLDIFEPWREVGR
jgi:hypothetical protein